MPIPSSPLTGTSFWYIYPSGRTGLNLGICRKQYKAADGGLDCAEIPFVYSKHVFDTQPLRCRNDAAIRQAKIEVSVERDQFLASSQVERSQRFECVCPSGDAAEEVQFGVDSQKFAKKVTDFGKNRGRNDDWAALGFEHLANRCMVRVIGIIERGTDKLTAAARQSAYEHTCPLV